MRHARPFLAALVLVAAVLPRAAYGDLLTFDLTARDALASVARYNAFIASLGKRAKGVKLVPGGTRFASQTCADLGGVYRLASVTLLEDPSVLPDMVVSRRARKDGPALESVFQAAGIADWSSATAEFQTNLPFWTAGPAAHGIRFVADAVTTGGDDGLLAAPGGLGVMRFRVNVTSAPAPGGKYRFLLELYGRTSSDDGALVKFAERRCFTFVDLEPVVDFGALAALVDATADPTLRGVLQGELAAVATAVGGPDPSTALGPLTHIVALAVQATPDPLPPPDARRLVAAVFAFRRTLLFNPTPAVCGNGTRESGEICDGTDLGGFDCARLGFQTGTLACDGACRFDTTGCVGKPVCGNGIREADEECDDGAANSDTLPDACRTTCRRAFCGDGVIDVFEDCEGTNLGGETCVSLGYDGGKLRCDAAECFFDDERCTLNDQ